MKQPINLRIDVELLEALDGYAKELSKSRTELIQKSIEFYFDKLDEMVADKRIDALKSGDSTIVPLSEVFKKAGINV
jgi:predicted DNA-binding protein